MTNHSILAASRSLGRRARSVRAHARRPTSARCAGRTRLCTRARHAARAGSGSTHTHITSPFLPPGKLCGRSKLARGSPARGEEGTGNL